VQATTHMWRLDLRFVQRFEFVYKLLGSINAAMQIIQLVREHAAPWLIQKKSTVEVLCNADVKQGQQIGSQWT